MKKDSSVAAGKGASKPITGANRAALVRTAGDSGTAKAMGSKVSSPHKGGNKSYRGCDHSSWGGRVKR